MAIWHLPLLWLTATRNDLLIYLTGWSYADYNLLHRWIGRMVAGLSLVHGGSVGFGFRLSQGNPGADKTVVLYRVYMWIAREHLWRNLQKEYWYCGCIVGCPLSLPRALALTLLITDLTIKFLGGWGDAPPHRMLDEEV
jgi:hypothetical protein